MLLIVDAGLFIGFTTRQWLIKLEEEGDVSPRQVTQFYSAVRGFYTTAATYALANLPVKDPVLQNSEFVNFADRTSATISQVTYFLTRSACIQCVN